MNNSSNYKKKIILSSFSFLRGCVREEYDKQMYVSKLESYGEKKSFCYNTRCMC